VEEVLKSVPSWLAKLIAEVGLDAALDATELLTRAETPSAFYEALRGMCASSGTSYQKTVRVHMLAGLTQGKCSCVGLWGSALAPGATKAMQLRALDWSVLLLCLGAFVVPLCFCCGDFCFAAFLVMSLFCCLCAFVVLPAFVVSRFCLCCTAFVLQPLCLCFRSLFSFLIFPPCFYPSSFVPLFVST
jgi:hypothetical protein